MHVDYKLIVTRCLILDTRERTPVHSVGLAGLFERL